MKHSMTLRTFSRQQKVRGCMIILLTVFTLSVFSQGVAVNLGLPSGTLWADRNIGADSPGDYGTYFAWGETKPKSVYSWSTYRYCKGTRDSLTKYCYNNSYGTVDDKTVLETVDDAATANWGYKWRMPTPEELKELCEKCTWTRTIYSGVNGYLVEGPNGNFIFLPAAGVRNDSSVDYVGSAGALLSASLHVSESEPLHALFLGFDFDEDYYSEDSGEHRCFGYSVRAVVR